MLSLSIAIIFFLGGDLRGTLAMSAEPECVCSRFHYEESMLEKMIRGEIKFENLKQSVVTDISGMNAQLDDMKRGMADELASMKRSVADELASMKQANEESVQKQREALTASTTSALDRVEKSLTDLADAKDSIQIPTVAFSSKGVADLTLNNEQVIVFGQTVFNYGTGYDSTTGIFTVPIGGVYLFTVHLCITRKKHIHYSIVVDDTEVTNGMNLDADHYPCTTATTIAVLQAGQKVWVKSKHSADELYQDSARWNMFSGVLIHQ